ncbi:MAG: glycosyltransferase family 39 protein [Anaerolineae bacterium]|nr:glycosyltransferase family 39 protein [Anaerolineae bacterium]
MLQDEPSVLDYVKSRLRFWDKQRIRIPLNPEDQAVIPVIEEIDQTETQASSIPAVFRIAWLALLPFGLALAAQFLLEPPTQQRWPAAAVYAVSAIAAAVAFWRGELHLAHGEPELFVQDDLKARWQLALVGAIMLLVSFVLFGLENFTFTSLNLSVWLASIVVIIFALGNLRFAPVEGLRALAVRLSAPKFSIRFNFYAMLVVAVLLVVAVFRFTDIANLPMDMVSDHAEKLYDVSDVLSGQTKIFFERNTGREAFQFYWTALMAQLFGTGISYMSLKIGTIITGLVVLYFVYRIGYEVGGKWVALYALLFTGVAYWANIISRVGLRFPLYPFCVAPVMYYLLRGLRTSRRMDFVWSGVWLGIGLHGYTSSRIVPLMVVVAIGLYMLDRRTKGLRVHAAAWGGLLAVISFAIFVPLFRYALSHWEIFNYRSFTRILDTEQALPGNPVLIFFSNTWRALRMFFVDNGEVWVHSIPGRPALDMITAAFFFVGAVLLLLRFIRTRHWRDIFLLVSIPILLLPSILSLAFPNENPNLNRTAGAYVPVFLIAALGFDAMLRGLPRRMAFVTGLLLTIIIVQLNYDLFFVQFRKQFDASSWNTAEMGEIMHGFATSVGAPESVYVIGFPYWVDTRLVGMNAGYPAINPEINSDMIEGTLAEPRAKMFMLNPLDTVSIDKLKATYPTGRFSFHQSTREGKNFLIFLVPPVSDVMPALP